MFSSAVYYRGAMTLAALRHLVGDADFFDILKTWVADHRHGNASTEAVHRARGAGLRE